MMSPSNNSDKQTTSAPSTTSTASLRSLIPDDLMVQNITNRIQAFHDRSDEVLDIFGHVAKLQRLADQGRLRTAGQNTTTTTTAAIHSKDSRLPPLHGELQAAIESAASEGICCAICCERPLEILAVPCGHLFACAQCAEDGNATITKTCMYCRAAITVPVTLLSIEAAPDTGVMPSSASEGLKQGCIVAQGFAA